MINKLTLFILLVFSTSVTAQTTGDKAKAFYQEAVKSFARKDYSKTLEYCQQVTEALKKTNARVELLRIKSHYELGQMDEAKASLKSFSSLPAEPPLKKEALSYLVKIEENEKMLREQKMAAERKAEEQRLEKERLIAEENRKKKEAETKSYQAALSGNVSAIRLFLKEYPNHLSRQEILDTLEVQEEQAYTNAVTKDDIRTYESYLNLFYDGKHKSFITGKLTDAKDRKLFNETVAKNTSTACETYLNAYPKGKNREAALALYEKTLYAEGQQAMLSKEYNKSEELFSKYISTFPTGSQLKSVQANHEQAQRKIKRAEAIANRENKAYWMVNYGTNESIGFDIGGLNINHKLSVYLGVNSSLNGGVFKLIGDNSPEEIESMEDYQGAAGLDPIFFTGSFGFTMEIMYPLWVYAGAGIRYQEYFEKETDTYYKIANPAPVQFFPEFGLKGRVGKRLVLKAGVQLIKDKPAFQFGIGF